MNKGMYIALSGAVAKQKHMEISAQNMANAATNGFKKDRIAFKEYMVPIDNKPVDLMSGRRMSQVSEIVTDYSGGAVIETGNPLDVAINGEGFFALEGNLYTRNGNFTVNSEGALVTQDGVRVLGDGGTLEIIPGSLDINSSGEIFIDNISIGKLKVVDFNNRNNLEKAGEGRFISKESAREIEADVRQGYLEGSNVNIVREMVQMISTMREFESYQKMLHAFDEAEVKVINELAK